jgi:predicted acyl esterase
MSVSSSLWNRRIEARDGVELAADIFFPEGKGPFPTLLLRTPYGRGRLWQSPQGWGRLVGYGYALVAVDVRGRNDSDGVWTPWVSDNDDAADVIEWITSQPWCAGKIGLIGGSYEGLTQWWAAAAYPSRIACMVPLAIGGLACDRPFFGTGIASQYRIWWMNLVSGKTMQYHGGPSWSAGMMHTPLSTLDEKFGLPRSAWQNYVRGELAFGGDAGTLSRDAISQVDVPVFIGVGWWDDQEAMRTWEALQDSKASRDCRLLIGAWDHAGNLAPRATLGGLDVSSSVIDTIAYLERFLASHLKGVSAAMDGDPRCRIFQTGAGRWDNLADWPEPAARATVLFLTSDGDARTLSGNGRLVSAIEDCSGSDTFVYDPNEPAKEVTDLARFVWADPPLDQRYLQRRSDALVYTTDILTQPVHISGRYRLSLHLSSDRADTDLYVSISDVEPDGRAIGLAPRTVHSASLRLRYRNGPRAEPLERGTIYEIEIEGSWLHHVFKPGHRIRVMLTSGNFPLMTRNAGTCRPWAEDEILLVQTNTVHHCAAYPSRLRLPVVPAGDG